MGSKKLTRKTSGTNTTAKSSPPPPPPEPPSDQDFCQRFFGDPLFTNTNVLLLFLFATFLPMIVWIPHFCREYARQRQSNWEEGERLKRIERSRLEFIRNHARIRSTGGMVLEDVENGQKDVVGTTQDSIGLDYVQTPFREEDVTVLEEDVFGSILHSSDRGHNHPEDSTLAPRKPTIRPTLCPDGTTYGYHHWFTLRDAISEANAMAAQDFLRWNKYLVMKLEHPDLEEPVFDTLDPFVICPGVKLNQRGPERVSIWGWMSSFFFSDGLTYSNQQHQQYVLPSNKNHKLSSIFINAEDITIQCEGCTIDLPGTHFSFGPHAKNVWIQGLTFKGATTSSLTLHHHGASVSFEGCSWLYNSGGIVSAKNHPLGMDGGGGGTMNAGAVADVNSTSSITFYRCYIDDQKQNPRRATVGAGLANVPGMNPNPPHGHGHSPGGGGMVMSSFTIRT